MAKGRNVFTAKKGTLKARVSGLGSEIGIQFRDWEEELGKLFTALGDKPVNLVAVFEKLVAELFTAIQTATPVDTGQARASWRLIAEALPQADTYQWRIVNGVPYIVFLEFGSSKQAPQGMVRINLAKFIKDTREGTRRVLKS